MWELSHFLTVGWANVGNTMTAKKKKTIIILAVITTLLIALIARMCWENTALELNTYTVTSDKLPDAFNGYRIAHVSDLHNAEMGDDNEKLLAMLRDAEPDIIAITGDLIDSRNTDVEIALDFAEKAIKIAPCYYVTGNHEARITKKEYDSFESGLTEIGVVVLHDDEFIIEKDGDNISLIGIVDPNFNRASIDIPDIENEPIADVGRTMETQI